MIIKFCPRCSKNKIRYTEKYCEECTIVVAEEQRKRYRSYNRERYSNKEEQKYVKFYSSNLWINERDAIKARDCGLCLPCFYSLFNGKQVIYKGEDTGSSDYIHHIKELREDWNSRLDSNNLISVCSSHHDSIHREYNKGSKEKEQMQKALRDILLWFLKNFYREV